ncbi:MAG: hypothetical protein IKC72_00720, partial [Clostridia bacterium]|nr:hypothetical protein [Clostridia bacterium]
MFAIFYEIAPPAPRSFATLEDDTFGVGRKMAVSTNCHSERSEESHSPPRFLLAQKSDMLATRARKKAFGVGRKTAFTHTAKCSKITEPPLCKGRWH